MFAFVEFPGFDGGESAIDGHLGEFREACALHPNGQAAGPETPAVTIRTFGGRHVVHQPVAIGGAGVLERFIQNLDDARESFVAFEQLLAGALG
jgi:hypothetical protein